ncbi:MAG: DUF805 domain-containing protein [Bacteroidales bacterium]|nr:DUF805 domain-containing protein [Bacteroidales bacterium]
MISNLLTVIKKYASFKGVASRSEFLSWALFLVVLFAIILGITIITRIPLYALFIAGLLLLLPTLAVAVRRMHDVGRSGWCVVIWLLVGMGTVIYGFLSGYLLQGMSPGYDEVAPFANIIMPILTIISLGLSILILIWLAMPSRE